MNKKVALAAATFLVAITGAFASSQIVSQLGYISKADRPSQALDCEEQILCSNTEEFTCQVLVGGASLYPVKFDQPDVCVTPLTHNAPIADEIQ